ncbi:TlpA family protein disulfide reductase [Thiolapillus brandeum]|uniref:Thioredoxin family protein n=1 Tax=Thiolapillus brandeum TaxID=1076588 RepID=A0A7U6GIK1_9GAMM|nr:TlpA disulfide reductase family protein [Thiolapillus brandeum]BAO44250.1 thioredoxin family protein [Thiolapillus brandeum]
MKNIVLVLMLSLFLQGPAGATGRGLTLLEDKPAAPDFSLKDIDGDSYHFSELKGKVVIVNFWATWCPPCRAEMPSMQRAWEQLREEGVMMLAVDVGEDEDAIFEFTASYPVEFPILLDTDSSVSEAWKVQGLPTTFVIDQWGRKVYRAVGGREWDTPELLKKIRELKEVP